MRATPGLRPSLFTHTYTRAWRMSLRRKNVFPLHPWGAWLHLQQLCLMVRVPLAHWGPLIMRKCSLCSRLTWTSLPAPTSMRWPSKAGEQDIPYMYVYIYYMLQILEKVQFYLNSSGVIACVWTNILGNHAVYATVSYLHSINGIHKSSWKYYTHHSNIPFWFSSLLQKKEKKRFQYGCTCALERNNHRLWRQKILQHHRTEIILPGMYFFP